MIQKIKNIIRSRLIFRNKVPQWVIERRKKCFGCKYNFKNKSVFNRTKKDWVWYFLNWFNSQCTICNCGVKYKTKIKEEYCSLENIGQKPKWDIYENK